MGKKTILIIDSILLFGILISIFLLVGYTQPLAIAPLPSDSQNGSLLFYLPKTDFIILDDNSRFDSFETIFIKDNVRLEPGRYFIKFFSGFNSEIRQIDIDTDNVVLEFKAVDNKIGVFNIGEKALNVETYDTGSLIDNSIAYVGGKNG